MQTFNVLESLTEYFLNTIWYEWNLNCPEKPWGTSALMPREILIRVSLALF